MRYVQKPDGTYSVAVTRNWVGGRQETYSYDTPTLPMTAAGAWREGARKHYAQERAEMTPEQRQADTTKTIIGFIVVVGASCGQQGTCKPEPSGGKGAVAAPRSGSWARHRACCC
jgi:hypothetical protein